jgi:hypothetical protein
MCKQCVYLPVEQTSTNAKLRGSSWKGPKQGEDPQYHFHRLYVADAGRLSRDAKNDAAALKRIAKEKGYEDFKLFTVGVGKRTTTYLVPEIVRKGAKIPSLGASIVRAITLRALDTLIFMEEQDVKRYKPY